MYVNYYWISNLTAGINHYWTGNINFDTHRRAPDEDITCLPRHDSLPPRLHGLYLGFQALRCIPPENHAETPTSHHIHPYHLIQGRPYCESDSLHGRIWGCALEAWESGHIFSDRQLGFCAVDKFKS